MRKGLTAGALALVASGLLAGAVSRHTRQTVPDSLITTTVTTVTRNGAVLSQSSSRSAVAVPVDTLPAPPPTVVLVHDTIPRVCPVCQPPAPVPPPAPAPAPAPPPVPPPTGVTPWITEDFHEYTSTANLLAYPNPMWSGLGEDVLTSRIFLDPSASVAGGKSMRYDFPDRTADPNLCHDYTIGRNIAFPVAVPEVWLELYAKFTPDFVHVVPSCVGTSSAGYKFVFLRVPVSDRYHMIVSLFGQSTNWHYPDGVAQEWVGAPNSSTYMDGQWHRWRFHAKVGSAGIATAYLDNTVIHAFTNVPINRTGIYGIALGRNLNQGPIGPRSIWWSGIRAYKTDPGWGF